MKLRPVYNKKGAALLIAILMASVMLSVGLGVYQRTYKELFFASFWKQTQLAFTSADSGLECALYWDLHPPVSPDLPICFRQYSSEWYVNNWTPGLAGDFTVGTGGSGCVKVVITKNATSPFTTILSYGYNNACASTSIRRVERGLRIDY